MLQLERVTKTFGPLRAVDNVSLSLQGGEIFGLLGPNGAGKSTAVNLAIGLLKPDCGEIRIADVGSPQLTAARLLMGVAPQSLSLYENLSAAENLSFFGQIHGLSGARLRERTDHALGFVGLTDRAGDRVSTFSGGMKRRLNLAVALIHDPPLLLLDEPTVGVDPQSRNAILEKVVELKAEGKTIVYTTHYMEEAQRLCDRVAILDEGRLLALDQVEALIEQHGGDSVVKAETAAGVVKEATRDPVAVLTRLQTGGGLVRFSVESPDLETVFLNLTGKALRD